jgi:regulator of RNase E activity RraA
MSSLSAANREALRSISTATLTTVLLKRGLRNQFIQVPRLNPQAPSMVGEAYTLRYIPSREDLDHVDVFKDPDHPQRKAVEEVPPGHVMVVDALRDTRSASAGGILMTRMMKRGAAGFVTDGGLRDTPDIERLDLPVYCAARSAPTNLIRLHAVDINVPIGCGGVPVYPGDIVVGDNEGVVIVPATMANEVTEEAINQTEFEHYVQLRVQQGASIFGLYPPNQQTSAAFEEWKKSKNKS